MVETSVIALGSSSIEMMKDRSILRRVHRQFGEVSERGVTGTKVVYGNAHTEIPDGDELGDVVLSVLHDE